MSNAPSTKSLEKSQVGDGGGQHVTHAEALSRHSHKPHHARKNSEASQGPGLLEMVAGDEEEEGDEQEHLTQRSSSIIK